MPGPLAVITGTVLHQVGPWHRYAHNVGQHNWRDASERLLEAQLGISFNRTPTAITTGAAHDRSAATTAPDRPVGTTAPAAAGADLSATDGGKGAHKV